MFQLKLNKNSHLFSQCWVRSFIKVIQSIGNVDVIKILIDYNADLSIKNENGQTPRDIAVEMAEELNSKGIYSNFNTFGTFDETC